MSKVAPIHLPLTVVEPPQRMPGSCARHGRPATTWRKTSFFPWWSARSWGLVFPGITAASEILALSQRQVDVQAWPFCEKCLSLRHRRLAYAYGGGPACLLLSVAAFASRPASLIGIAGLIGVLAVTPVMVSAFGTAARWPSVVRGRITRGGTLLTIRKPAPEFVASLPSGTPRPARTVPEPAPLPGEDPSRR